MTTPLHPDTLPALVYTFKVGDQVMLIGSEGARELMEQLIADGMSNYDIQNNFRFYQFWRRRSPNE